MFKLMNPFKKKVDPEREWMISMIVALARLVMVKPHILAREVKDISSNKNYLNKLVNGN